MAGLARPEGLYFTNISMEKTSEEENTKVIISGFSKTRDNLLEFKDTIEKYPKIKNVSFPPANWIKAKDVVFSLTFNLEINAK
jgi:hypothetical protein